MKCSHLKWVWEAEDGASWKHCDRPKLAHLHHYYANRRRLINLYTPNVGSWCWRCVCVVLDGSMLHGSKVSGRNFQIQPGHQYLSSLPAARLLRSNSRHMPDEGSERVHAYVHRTRSHCHWTVCRLLENRRNGSDGLPRRRYGTTNYQRSSSTDSNVTYYIPGTEVR